MTRPGRRPVWWLPVGAGFVFLVLIALGTWQVQRLAWKEELIARIDARIHAAPVPLQTVLNAQSAGEDIEYRPVKLRGRFDHAREQYFLATHRGASGWHVYTPLETDAGDWIFVNRGFVPYDRRDPALRPEGQIEDIVEITGLARSAPGEKPSIIVPDNDPEGRTYYWKDLSAMRVSAGLPEVLPLFVDADDAPNPGRLPEGGVTLVSLPNNHLQYAVTWYGLALALAGVLAFWIAGQRRARRP